MIIVYHACPTFVCGSIDTTIRWWAALDASAWRFMFYGAHNGTERAALEQRIRLAARLEATPALAAAAAQDARAEAPDL